MSSVDAERTRRSPSPGSPSARVPPKRRAVADRPLVPKRIPEAALAVRSPRHLVIGDRRSDGGAGGDGPCYEVVGIVEKHLDARARHAGLPGAGLGRVL